MLKFAYKGQFLTIKKVHDKFLYWKCKQWAQALMGHLTNYEQNIEFWAF
jgi:hypothetical protein